MRSYLCRTASLLLVGVMGSVVAAEPTLMVAEQDFTQVSQFTLSFTDFGIESSSAILSTNYELRAESDVVETARFTNYFQDVEPLLLPDPTGQTAGISTGDMFIRVVPGSSEGTYDSATGEFATTELYEIRFTGDLSAFGITSPIYLPSTSAGTVQRNPDGTGLISLQWAGEGELPNIDDPSAPIRFTYVCQTHTEFNEQNRGDLNDDGAINLSDFSVYADCHGRGAPGGNCGVVDYIVSDMDGNGLINLLDFAIFALNFSG